MTENQQIKVLKSAKQCTLYEKIKYKDTEDCTFKEMLFNAVLGRYEKGFTQQDAANYLDISIRTVKNLEKGKCKDVVLLLNYIHFFKHDFAAIRQKESYKKFVSKKSKL